MSSAQAKSHVEGRRAKTLASELQENKVKLQSRLYKIENLQGQVVKSPEKIRAKLKEMERQVAKRDTELQVLEADIREQARNNELCGELQKMIGERSREMADCNETYKRLKSCREELE